MAGRRWWFVGAGGILIGLLGIAIVRHNGWQSAEVPDAGQPATLSLSARPGDGWPMSSVTGVSVWVTGEIDGEAEVWAGNWGRQRLSGRVDWRVYHDWFEPSCQLHYQPLGPVSGKLLVRFRFH